MSVRFLLSGVALIALTACGGGGGGGGGDLRNDLFDEPASFDELVSETAALTSYLNSSPTAALPQNDAASYRGIIVLADALPVLDRSGAVVTPGSSDGYIGRVAMNVNFGQSNASVDSGTADNFYSASLKANGDPETATSDILVGSSLTFTSGTFSDVDFILGVSGTVDTINIFGNMDASFAADDARAIIARETGDGLTAGAGDFDARLIADDRSR